jgi:regulator of protease activity HflC (stomatin/prohibitin superfamily)
LDLNRQLILTKDNITIDIDTIVYYRLIDIIKSTYRVKEIVTAVKEITYATLRSVCGEHTLQDLLENRAIIANEIELHVFETVASWGNLNSLTIGVYVE